SRVRWAVAIVRIVLGLAARYQPPFVIRGSTITASAPGSSAPVGGVEGTTSSRAVCPRSEPTIRERGTRWRAAAEAAVCAPIAAVAAASESRVSGAGDNRLPCAAENSGCPSASGGVRRKQRVDGIGLQRRRGSGQRRHELAEPDEIIGEDRLARQP